MTRPAVVRIVVSLLLWASLAVGLWKVWIVWHVLLYDVYLLFVGIVALSAILQWPREEWFAYRNALSALSAWGRQVVIRGKYQAVTVSDLAGQAAVTGYFSAEIRIRDTRELCKEIRGALISKGIAYALFTGLLLFALPEQHNVQEDPSITAVKTWGVFATFAMLAIWDLSACWRQYQKNSLLEQPHHQPTVEEIAAQL